MKRYKTILAVLCGGAAKHQNLVDNRVVADSPEKARNTTLLSLPRRKCAWCDAMLTNYVQEFGTEELPLHPEYTVLGYTCHCGERVPVLRFENNTQFTPPDSITVSCSNGHSRTIQNPEFLSLQHWQEKTQ